MSSAIDCASACGGYAWWYVEVTDSDERYGLTLILFAGSVFSPFYAERLRRGQAASGLQHPAVNLTLYERPAGEKRPRAQRLWVMNEYPPEALTLDERRIVIARSVIEYADDGSARIELSEETTQFFGDPDERVTVRLRIGAQRMPEAPLLLGKNAAGDAHFWQPLIVGGAAEVELHCGALSLRFSGRAYCDRNFGSGRLEDTFSRWSWAHGLAEDADSRRALLLYRAQRRDGGVTGLAVAYDDLDSPRRVSSDAATTSRQPTLFERGFLWLPVPTRVAVGDARCDRQRPGRLEDGPFYARYLARLADAAGSYVGVGEYLDLDRFCLQPVQDLLTFKTRLVPS
jgi:carotenoid 1,2-hydratase